MAELSPEEIAREFIELFNGFCKKHEISVTETIGYLTRIQWLISYQENEKALRMLKKTNLKRRKK